MPLRPELPCAVPAGAFLQRDLLLTHRHPVQSFFHYSIEQCVRSLRRNAESAAFPALDRTRPIGSFLYRTLIGMGRRFSVDNRGLGRRFSVNHGLLRPWIQRKKAADSAKPLRLPSRRPRIQRGQIGISGKNALVPRKAADSAHTLDGARLGLLHRRVCKGPHG